jgi:hypothetical protein
MKFNTSKNKSLLPYLLTRPGGQFLLRHMMQHPVVYAAVDFEDVEQRICRAHLEMCWHLN